MYGTSIPHEVGAGPGIGGEENRRKEVRLEAIAARAREDNVPRMMRAAVRERIYVIERCGFEVEGGGAVDAAATAVSHGRALYRALVSGSAEGGDAGTSTVAGGNPAKVG
jgi:hypothetical protein